MRKVCVLYHGGGCRDGFCSAFVARRALRQYDDVDVVFIPVQYGEPLPILSDNNTVDTIYLLDFCFPLGQMIELHNRSSNFLVIDHHKTAKDVLDQLHQKQIDGHLRPTTGEFQFNILYNLEHSSAYLTWELFFKYGSIAPPGIVQYVEDRDLWKWQLPASRAVNAAIRSYGLDFDVWDRYFGFEDLPTINLLMRNDGFAILRAEQETIDSHVRHAAEIEIGGYKVLAVNATTLISEITGQLAEGRPFGASYFVQGDDTRIWSLRSRGDDGIDVSEIAKQYGGGGHRNAAGFQEKSPCKLDF